jgi:LysM repeat protein
LYYRQPFVCPPGAISYFVRPGDTLYKIALKFNTTVENLIASNPQLPNPNLIFINQQLCIPNVPLRTPCSIILNSKPDVVSSIRMSAAGLIHTGPNGELSLSIMATLPAPSELSLQRYDIYLLTDPPSGVSKQLHSVPNNTNLWATRIDDLEPYIISQNSIIYISGSPTESAFPPPGDRILLEGSLKNCR